METQQQVVSPIAIGVRFGLLVALVAILIDFLLRTIGINVLAYGAVTLGAGLVVAVVGVVAAHRAFRQANGGLMSYGQGVLIAVIAISIWMIASGLFNYLYVNYIDPEFVDRMKGELTAFMERKRVPEQQIAQSTAGFEEMRPSLGKALLKGVESGAITGTILGVLISAFTKRKPADFA